MAIQRIGGTTRENKISTDSTAATTAADVSDASAVETQPAVTNTNTSGVSRINKRGTSSSGIVSTAGTAVDTAADATATETPKATMRTPTTTANNASNTSTTTTANTSTYTPTGMYDPANLEAYNRQRESDIRSLYDTAQQNTLAGLKTAYDQNLSTAQAAMEQITPQYQQSANALSAEYERQRRNNNMQANLNGLNSGAGSQMALAQSANYQANQAGLARQQNQALDEANRAIADLQMNYQNAIAEATANNNYQKAAALLDEYENAYNRQMAINDANYTRAWNEDERNYSRNLEEASNKAQYGDFSGYAALYGNDIASAMELTWALQNPQIAWAAGKLSAEDYEALTGQQPNGISSSNPYNSYYGRVQHVSPNSPRGYSYYGGGGGSSYSGSGSGSGSGTGSGTGTTPNAATTAVSPFGSSDYYSGVYSGLTAGEAAAYQAANGSPFGTAATYGNIGNNKLTVGG